MSQAQKLFWTYLIEHVGDVAMWNLISVCLEAVLVLVEDRCIVCAKHTIGSEIILDAPVGTPR
jgi:hypothetical protein